MSGDAAVVSSGVKSARYPASWVDRLTQTVDKLPAPAWLTYAGVGLLLVAVFVAVQAWHGAYRQTGFFGWHIFIALQPIIPLAAVHYLDGVAEDAIQRFRQAMKGDEKQFELARERLTTMPARATLVAGVFGVAVYLLLFVIIQDLEVSLRLIQIPYALISIGVFFSYLTLAWFIFGAWVYHTIHQLRVIHRLYTTQAAVDPFHPEPLYALSSITSRTAIVILANSYGWFGVNMASGPVGPSNLVSLVVTNVFFVGLGLLIFIWPLWGAHRLLETAKHEAMSTNAYHYRIAVEELHSNVANRAIDPAEGWEKALSALDGERKVLERVPTWPWAPGSLRNLIAALLVPILVWAAQLGLQRFLE